MVGFSEHNGFFSVRIELFDGPIDLLLHLVKSRELPIEKLSLAEVTAQYLECVENMRHLDLEIAGEYLVIAATLISIKAAVLLNEPVDLVPDGEGNLVDPHDELLRRLREAEIYKEGARHLLERDFLGIDVFSPPSSLGRFPPPPAVEFASHSPMLLGKAFRRVLERIQSDKPLYRVVVASVSVVERMVYILDALRYAKEALPFEKLIPDLNHRSLVIASFVALLELCKRQVIVVSQDQCFDTIYVGLAADKPDFSEFSSEFDTPGGGDQGIPLAANLT